MKEKSKRIRELLFAAFVLLLIFTAECFTIISIWKKLHEAVPRFLIIAASTTVLLYTSSFCEQLLLKANVIQERIYAKTLCFSMVLLGAVMTMLIYSNLGF